MSRFMDHIFNQRRFRVDVSIDPAKSEASSGIQPLGSFLRMKEIPFISLPKPFKNYRTTGTPDFRLSDEPGECIYCGSTSYAPNSSRALGEEHIIAAGLGGNLVLPGACCSICEGRTGSSEQKVLRGVFAAARKQLGLKPSRKRRPEQKQFPCTTTIDGNEVTIDLPIRTHPGLIALPVYMPPNIFAAIPEGASTMCGLWSRAVNFNPTALTSAGLTNVKGELDTLPFIQMLAKTAHSFLVAEFGLKRFQPKVRDFAITKFERDENPTEIFEFIGGSADIEPPTDNTHEIGWYPYGFDTLLYLVVRIRLFAKLGAPTYHVVAGHVIDGKLFMDLTRGSQ
ncbi:hypothetical protein AB1P65_17420 [Roseibium alexandrii]